MLESETGTCACAGYPDHIACLAHMQRSVEASHCYSMYPQTLPVAYDWIVNDVPTTYNAGSPPSDEHAVISWGWLMHLYDHSLTESIVQSIDRSFIMAA